jgi:hypothetical protein
MSMPRNEPVYPRRRGSIHIIKEAGWVPGPIRTGAENHVPTEIRSPDCEGLYTDNTIPCLDECIQVLTWRRNLVPPSSGKSKRVWGSRPHQTVSYRLNYKASYSREMEASLGHSYDLQSSVTFTVNTQQTSHGCIWRWMFLRNVSTLPTYQTQPCHSPERHNVALHCLVDLKSTFVLVMITKLNDAFMHAFLTTHVLFLWIESNNSELTQTTNFVRFLECICFYTDCKSTSSRSEYISMNCGK